MHKQVTALLLACTLFTGCYTSRRFPVTPVPVQLVSPTGFRINLLAGPNGPASTCVVRRAQVEVSAVTTDTLHFAHLKVLNQQAGAELCAHGGPGFVLLAEHPDLRSERGTINGALTFGAIILAIPVALIWLMPFLWTGT